jgi:hypothetical protein
VAAAYTLTATYSGDTLHAGSAGAFALTATTTLAGGGPGSHPGSGTVTIPVTTPLVFGALAIGSIAPVSRRHVAALVLACTGGVGATCVGTVTLKAKVKVKAKRKGRKRRRGRARLMTITAGTVSYSLSAGQVMVFAVKLPGVVFQALAASRHGSLKVTASAPGGHVTVALTRPQRARRKHRATKHKR